jgi:hypothetical protein
MEYVMQFITKWLELTYALSFRRPSFDFLSSQLAVSKALVDAFSPRFAIATADIAVDSSRILRDVKTTVTLFGGLVKLEITADNFQATFTNPIAPGDVEIVKDTVRLATGAISEVLNDLLPGSESISLRAFLELHGKNTNAWQYLQSLSNESFAASDGSPLAKAGAVPGKQINFVSTEKWTFNFELSRAWRSDKEVYTTSNAVYEHDSDIHGMDDAAKHFELCVRDVLKSVGLEPFQEKEPKSLQ